MESISQCCCLSDCSSTRCCPPTTSLIHVFSSKDHLTTPPLPALQYVIEHWTIIGTSRVLPLQCIFWSTHFRTLPTAETSTIINSCRESNTYFPLYKWLMMYQFRHRGAADLMHSTRAGHPYLGIPPIVTYEAGLHASMS